MKTITNLGKMKTLNLPIQPSTLYIGVITLLFMMPLAYPVRHVPSRITPTSSESINVNFKRRGSMSTATEVYVVRTRVPISEMTEEFMHSYMAFQDFFQDKAFLTDPKTLSAVQFAKYAHASDFMDLGLEHAKRFNAITMSSAHFNASWISTFVREDGSFDLEKLKTIDMSHFAQYKILGEKFIDRSRIYAPEEEVVVSHFIRDSGYGENFGHQMQHGFEENPLIHFFYGLTGQKTRQNYIDIGQNELLEKLNNNAKQTRTDLQRLSANSLTIANDLAKNVKYQQASQTLDFTYDYALNFEKTIARFADGIEETTHDNKVSNKLLPEAEIEIIKNIVNERLAKKGDVRIRLPDILRAPLVPLFTLNGQGDINLDLIFQIVVHERTFDLYEVNSSPFLMNEKLYDIAFPKPLIALHDTHYSTFDDRVKVEYVEMDYNTLDQCNKVGNNFVCAQSLFLSDPANSCIATAALQPQRITQVCLFHRTNASFTVNPMNDTHWKLYTSKPIDIHQDCPPPTTPTTTTASTVPSSSTPRTAAHSQQAVSRSIQPSAWEACPSKQTSPT